MSLVVDHAEAPRGPRTHALIVGVNEYPHLLGGSGALAPSVMGLSQLSSPVYSAVAISRWIERNLANGAAPLDTVELLLSPEPATQARLRPPAVERATMANIEAAFGRWYERCNMFEDNVGLLYFCGHGVEVRETVLLPEDFGANRLQPWDTAIDMSETFLAMGQCLASTQCFFLDCCREVPLDLLAGRGMRPRPLLASTGLSYRPRAAPLVKAAAYGAQAFGPSHAASHFATALLDCLRGVGADHYDGLAWKVTTDSLVRAMSRCVARTQLAGGQRASCSPGGGEHNLTKCVHEFGGRAPVLACVGCAPTDAIGSASFAAQDATGVRHARTTPANCAWEIEIESGVWDFEATFGISSSWKDGQLMSHIAHPPYCAPNIPVSPRVAMGGNP